MSLRAAAHLAAEGVGTRVVDLRWLAPLPVPDIIREASATGRVLVVDETRRSGGVGEGVIAALVDAGYVGAARRVAAVDCLVPLGPAARTVLTSEITRSQLGHDLNLDGHDTEHFAFEGEVVYRNPFLGLRLMDEEIAIATLLAGTAAWVRGEGPEPYPLAQGCQDHHLSLAIDRAAETGAPVVAGVGPWAK